MSAKRLRIAVNALSAVSGGGTSYLEGFLPALAEVDTWNEYILLRAPWQDYLPPAPGANFRWLTCPIRKQSAFARYLFEQTSLVPILRRERIDVLYATAELATLAAPCPVVLCLRNLNAYSLRWQLGWNYWKRSMVLRELARLSAWRAERVIFISEISRGIIAKKLHIPARKTVVIHHGTSPAFRAAARREGIAPATWVKRPYLLSVSQIRQHKNYPRLVEAFISLVRPGTACDLDLVILGAIEDAAAGARMRELIRGAGMEDRIHLPGAVPHQELPAWYAGATLFVFPSLLETFGLPLVEAMASGLPVVAANAPAIPEIVGDAGIYFDPWSPESMASAIRQVLDDRSLAGELSRRSIERARQFSWVEGARQTVRVFEEASRRG